MSNDITWDEPHSDVVWDDNGQADKARALVHSGQNSFFPNMATAAGKELVEMAHKLTNLGEKVVPDSLIPASVQAFGDSDMIKKLEAADQPAFDAPGGKFGQMVAGQAATIPIGGPIEAGLGKVLSPLAKTLAGKLITKGITSAASGGAIAGATADPGERGGAAGTGAALGGTLSALGTAGGRVADGLVEKSPALETLEGDVARSNALPGAAQRKLFVPISQGANPNDATSALVGKFYKTALPYVPGVESQLTGQADRAGNTLREAMLQLSSPDGHVVPAGSADNTQLATKLVKDEHDAIYKNLKNVPDVPIPANFASDLKANLKQQFPDIPTNEVDGYVGSIQDRIDKYKGAGTSNPGSTSSVGPTSAPTMSAWNVKNLRDDIQGLNKDLPMRSRDMTNEAKDQVDQLLLDHQANIGAGPQSDAIQDYLDNRPNYENFGPLARAVRGAKAKQGKFAFGTVAPKANDMTDIEGIDQNAKEILGNKAAQISQAGRIAGYGVTGALAGIGHIPALATIAAGGNALATEGAQKFLYGDTALQGSMRKLLENNPKLAAALGYGVRSAAAVGVGNNFDGEK